MRECKSFGLADGFLGICSRCMTLGEGSSWREKGEGRREKRERREERGERRKEKDKNAAN